MGFRTKYKCDVIIYNKTTAVGLIYFPQCHKAPVKVFSMKAKDCPANNYLLEWKPLLLGRILSRAKYSVNDKIVARELSYKTSFKANGTLGDPYWRCVSLIYKNSEIDIDNENQNTDKADVNNIIDTLKKSFKRLFSRASETSILFKLVHCTKYVRKIPYSAFLDYNVIDNHWYYIKSGTRENTFTRPCISLQTWKANIRYTLIEKEFIGTVVKIETIPFVSYLGIYDSNEDYDRHLYKTKPTKMDCFYIPVATVFYQNGRKRKVPLACIKEYEGFENGACIEELLTNLKQIQEDNPSNKIKVQNDGTIKIENTLLSLREDHQITKTKQQLFLNVKKRTAYTYFGRKISNDMFFKITDNEYEEIFGIMKNQIKEECGFVPDLVYGETNFDKLINFARSPFAPELNEFSLLFNKLPLSGISKDYNGKECVHPFEVEKELSHSPDCVRKFIKYCGLPYTPKNIKELLKGHRNFAALLGAWELGFRNQEAIDILLNADNSLIFSDIVFQYGAFCDYIMTEAEMVLGRKDFSEKNFTFVESLQILEDIKFLFELFDEITCAKVTADLLTQEPMIMDAFNYFKILSNENLLSEAIIKKIGREGLTTYNHDMVMRTYRQAHPEEKEQFKNQPIVYSQAEENLKWEKNGYKFCLPEDTDRLVDIGYKMNICVGHLYRDKAASKECTIVYAIKGDEYELCIEIQKKDNQHFKLIQKSAFSNRSPKGELLKTFNEWCLQKGVV